MFLFFAIVRKVSGQIKTSINTKQAISLGIISIILISGGCYASYTGVFLSQESKPILTPSIMPTPTPATTTPPTPTPYIIGTNNTWGWKTHREDNKSSINITSILGMTGNAIEISYDLKEKGCVSIYKEINPEKLFGKEGIIFFYKASGGHNTLTIGLEYEDSTQFISSGRATVTDKWVPVKVPFHQFKRWNDEESVDLKKVCKIVFIIWNCPEQGDVYGSGWVIIDDVQAITS